MRRLFDAVVAQYGQDNRGNRTKTAEWVVPGCYAYPNQTDEPGQFDPQPVTGATLVGPVDAHIPDDARVTIPAPHPQAGEWQVEGEYAGIESPLSGWRPGGYVKLKKVGRG